MRPIELPTDTWMVIDATARWRSASVHSSRHDAEIERDQRNQGLTNKRYTACLVLEPVAERMFRPWR